VPEEARSDCDGKRPTGGGFTPIEGRRETTGTWPEVVGARVSVGVDGEKQCSGSCEEIEKWTQ
jgi:hypothetical protein